MKNLKKFSKSPSKSAFTFVEISIVIVIIGLLMAGITTGSEIMTNSKISKVVTDANIYKSAIITFRDNYNAMPGDLSSATSYWGKDSASCNSDPGTATANGTCNGLGDGTVNLIESNGAWESYRAWQQLSLANFIPGAYAGKGVSGTTYGVELGTTIPQGSFKNSGFTIYWSELTSLNNIASNFEGQNIIAFGARLTGDNPAFGSALDANTALRIDTKYDDGIANNGDIMGQNGTGSAGCESGGTYASTTDILSCRIGFVIK